MRKSLLENRAFALSFIFLLSNDSSMLSKFSPEEKFLIKKDLNLNRNLKNVKDTIVLTCHHMHQMLQEDDIDEDKANENIDDIRRSCADNEGKVATKIASSLLNRLLNLQRDCESNLIIEALCPYIFNCIISPCKGMKFEWMTYRMVSYTNDGQLMIPDIVLYVDPISTINFELFVVEVKKHDNFGNGNLEKDLIKLGKEMQLALDKLVVFKVESPEVIGLPVEGVKGTTFKMELVFDGQYRIIELGQFFIVRENANDVMLIPAAMQRLEQMKDIVEETKKKLYKAVKGKSTSDATGFMRKACKSPIIIKK